MRFRGTLILLGISLLVASLYLFYLQPRAREQKLIEELSSRFFRVDVSEVEFLRIQNQNGVFNMVKEADQWKLTAPLPLPTDNRTLQKIFEIITKGKIVKVITNDMSRAAEFRLDHPVAALFIGYKGKIDELDIGGSNPAGTGFYAFARGINAIFVVEEEIAEIATVGLYNLRSKSVFSFAPEAVTGIRIIRKDEDITLRKEAGTWKMLHPVSGRGSDQDISDFLLGVLNQRADEFYDHVVPDSRDYGGTITIQLYSGEQVSADIAVHYWGTDANQGTVSYQKGMPYAGRLSRDFWNFAGTSASAFRYRNLFDVSEGDIRGIMVVRGSTSYELLKKGDDWYAGDRPADRKRVTELIWFLKAWKASKLLPSPVSTDNDRLLAEISLKGKDNRMIGNVKVYEKTGRESIGFAAEEEQFLHYALSDNLLKPCAVSSIDLKKIPDVKELTQ